MSEIKTIKIEKLVNHALGLGRLENNKIVFVPGVLPSEVIEAKIIKEKKDVVFAEPIKIIEPSAERIEPSCPYFNSCGGCDLQFASYSKQLEIKKDILRDWLKINDYDIEVSILAAPQEWQYRNTAVFHRDKKKVGFYAKKSHTVISIKQCPILIPKLFDSVEKNNWPSELKLRIGTDNDVVTSVSQLKNNHFLIENIDYKVWIKNFFQTNTSIIPSWLHQIKDYLQPQSSDVVLDLFSGVGLITLYIAPMVKQIYGIEVERASVKRAMQNSTQNDIKNAYFFAGSTEKHINRIPKVNKMIVDPPRTGINSATIKAINNINPDTLVYVSCYPSTFFRDIKILNRQLTKITLVDMFPQTSHFEIVALLEPKS